MSIQDNPLKLKLFVLDGESPNFPNAKCAEEGVDPDTWFLDDAEISKAAKGACCMCPYGPPTQENDWTGDDTCYNYTLKVEEQTGFFAFGIFGARDAAERQRVLDLKRIAKGLGTEFNEDE